VSRLSIVNLDCNTVFLSLSSRVSFVSSSAYRTANLTDVTRVHIFENPLVGWGGKRFCTCHVDEKLAASYVILQLALLYKLFVNVTVLVKVTGNAITPIHRYTHVKSVAPLPT